MKFGLQFEMQKIPEWYDNYIDYGGLKEKITSFKKRAKDKKLVKLHSFYMLTLKSHEIVALCQHDTVYKSKEHLSEKEFQTASEKAHLDPVGYGKR